MSISKFFFIKRFFWKEQLQVIRRYYPKSFRFACIDLSLGILSLFVNPYRACRKYWEKQEVSFPFYGETPITTLEKIINYLQLSSDDVFLELGSGRGKGCFWVSQIVGCTVIGVEKVPYFASTSDLLSRFFRTSNLKFITLDMEKADVSQATCIYLDTTGMSEGQLIKLGKQMENIQDGARVITVSNPLKSQQLFSQEIPRIFPFPWDEAKVFSQIKKTIPLQTGLQVLGCRV